MEWSSAALAWMVVLASALAACGEESAVAKTATSHDEPLAVTLHPTFGPSGVPRPAVYLSGEHVFFSIEMRGVQATDQGRARLRLRLEYLDTEGNALDGFSSGDYRPYLAFRGEPPCWQLIASQVNFTSLPYPHRRYPEPPDRAHVFLYRTLVNAVSHRGNRFFFNASSLAFCYLINTIIYLLVKLASGD